jgi:hypothetical protein
MIKSSIITLQCEQTSNATHIQTIRCCFLILHDRCKPKNSVVNGDGFNDDPRTFMQHDTVTTEGELSDECSVFMVQGLRWDAIATTATPCYAWQVLRT